MYHNSQNKHYKTLRRKRKKKKANEKRVTWSNRDAMSAPTGAPLTTFTTLEPVVYKDGPFSANDIAKGRRERRRAGVNRRGSPLRSVPPALTDKERMDSADAHLGARHAARAAEKDEQEEGGDGGGGRDEDLLKLVAAGRDPKLVAAGRDPQPWYQQKGLAQKAPTEEQAREREMRTLRGALDTQDGTGGAEVCSCCQNKFNKCKCKRCSICREPFVKGWFGSNRHHCRICGRAICTKNMDNWYLGIGTGKGHKACHLPETDEGAETGLSVCRRFNHGEACKASRSGDEPAPRVGGRRRRTRRRRRRKTKRRRRRSRRRRGGKCKQTRRRKQTRRKQTRRRKQRKQKHYTQRGGVSMSDVAHDLKLTMEIAQKLFKKASPYMAKGAKAGLAAGKFGLAKYQSR